MKTLTTIAAIVLIVLIGTKCHAQAITNPQKPPEQPVSIKILPSQLDALKVVLSFSYNWLPKSDAPAKDVGQAVTLIQQLFPVLVADTTKKPVVKPVIKK